MVILITFMIIFHDQGPHTDQHQAITKFMLLNQTSYKTSFGSDYKGCRRILGLTISSAYSAHQRYIREEEREWGRGLPLVLNMLWQASLQLYSCIQYIYYILWSLDQILMKSLIWYHTLPAVVESSPLPVRLKCWEILCFFAFLYWIIYNLFL